MELTKLYVRRADMSACLGVCISVFNSWLVLTNDNALRFRKIRYFGKAAWVYELESTARFLKRFTYKFDAKAEAALRSDAFELEA